MVFAKMTVFILLVLTILYGCGNTLDDLSPSGADKRPQVQCGIPGPDVCQTAPDFTLSDTLGNDVTLSSVVPAEQGTVLYFTMWCPICDGEMTNLMNSIIPAFPNVRFFAVDYVSATVAEASSQQSSSGFDNSGFTVLADTNRSVLSLYHATMGTTVVIDRNGVIRMSEDYKDGVRLQSVLASLP